jgi:hypothetical protein
MPSNLLGRMLFEIAGLEYLGILVDANAQLGNRDRPLGFR